MITQSFLYNAIFLIYACADEVLPHQQQRGPGAAGWRSRSATWPARCCSGTVRHPRAGEMIAGTDRLSGPCSRPAPGCSTRGAARGGETLRLDSGLFFASAGRERGELDGQRDLSDRDQAEAKGRDIRHRHVVGAVGPAFYGVLIGNGAKPHRAGHRLRGRRRDHDRRRAGRDRVRPRREGKPLEQIGPAHRGRR